MQRFVYFVTGGGCTKIGLSIDPERRIRQLQEGCPVPLVLIGSLPGNQHTEALIHETYADRRLHGEWFDFEATPEQVVEVAAWLAERAQHHRAEQASRGMHPRSREEAIASGMNFWVERVGSKKIWRPLTSTAPGPKLGT